ncbi:MAG: MFS transporter [Candidatus Hodarchaeales archaeon]|jgi:MFS family permease
MSSDINVESQKIQRGALGVLFMAVFIDLLEFGIIVPLLPFWALESGATPFIYGILSSVYSLMSFVLAPVWGRLSDKYGRRPVIMAGLLGTVLSLGMLLVTAVVAPNSLLMLFLSRVIGGGFTAATLPTSQAYISDTTEGKDRAKAFGLIGAAFGIGFAIGPALGGILSNIGGYALPAFVATLLASINLLAAVKYLPESLTEAARKKRSLTSSEKTASNLAKVIFQKPTIYLSIILFGGISLAFSKMQSTLALLGNVRFGLDESSTGIVFFIIGITAVIAQGGILRPLTDRFKATSLIMGGLILLIVGFLGLSTVHSLLEMLIWVIPLVIGSSIVNPTLGAFLSKEVPTENSGVILGLNQSVGSLLRIFGPLIGTFVFEFNEAFPYYLGTFILGISTIFALTLYFMERKRIFGSPCINCGTQLQLGVANCSNCGLSIDIN